MGRGTSATVALPQIQPSHLRLVGRNEFPVKMIFPRIVLMLGNVVIGLTILGPAGMLAELADGLRVGIHDTGLLVTYGAIVLCVGSPLMAWLTTRIDRRALLVSTLVFVAVGQAVSALAPNYSFNLLLRLAVLAVAAVYTPQAAATVSLIVADRERPSAIAFVFLGWSLAIAGGLPLVTLIATHFGWQAVYGVLAVVAAVVAALLFAVLPKGLQGKPLSPQSFVAIAHSKRIMLILLVTLLQTSGQFTVFIYLAPLLKALTGAGAAIAGGFFAFYGVIGLIGNVVASADRDDPRNTENARTVYGLDADRSCSMGGRCRLAAGDGRERVLLGFRICRDQFDATGTIGGSGPGSRERLGRAQYVSPLRRAGCRLRHRWSALCARVFPHRRLCRRGVCRARMCAAGGHVGAFG